MIKDVPCRGLEDSEGDQNQGMTLETVFGAKEAGCIQATGAVAGSSYRRWKKALPKNQEICAYCGTTDETLSQEKRMPCLWH